MKRFFRGIDWFDAAMAVLIAAAVTAALFVGDQTIGCSISIDSHPSSSSTTDQEAK